MAQKFVRQVPRFSAALTDGEIVHLMQVSTLAKRIYIGLRFMQLTSGLPVPFDVLRKTYRGYSGVKIRDAVRELAERNLVRWHKVDGVFIANPELLQAWN